jgi:integrase
MKPRPVDTKTRYQSVYARHQLHCALGVGGKRCNCDPSYYGVAWDREAARHRKTKHRPRAVEARNLRADLLGAISEGTITESSGLTVAEAHKRFVEAIRDGIALNKKGKPYKANAIVDIDSSLKRLPDSVRNCPFEELRRGQLQRAVDDFRSELSGSRIRSIVNAVRSLYRWGQDRELVTHDPATLIRLPAFDSTARDRVATPGEFAKLLAALETEDKVPFALAGYGSARSQEVRHLEWPEVDFERAVLLLADDDSARKSESARRIVPMVRPLVKILREEWLRQGRPKSGRVCLPRRESKSGMLALGTLQKRVSEAWGKLKLEPIGLQESRHTTATWLDHAGVSPKVASQFLGHKTPELQAGAAAITLARYTHVLAGELERARDQLGTFLAEREAEEARAAKRTGSR